MKGQEKLKPRFVLTTEQTLVCHSDGDYNFEAIYFMDGWGAPYGYRCLNWDKFGMPDHGVGYSGNWLTPITHWWIDPIKKEMLNRAKNNSEMTIPIENEIVDHWNNLKK